MSFDLNINNYTKREIEEFFGLPPQYDITLLQTKEHKLRDTILNNREISKETQIRTLNFLIQAKNILIPMTQNDSNANAKKTKELNEKVDSIYHLESKLVPSMLEGQNEHMVQDRPVVPYVTSSPSEYFQGVINPLKRKVIKKNLNIDTRFRENYYTSPSTNFNFNLPISFNDVMNMQLTAIELPTTFYNISKQYNNNYFTLNVDGFSKIVTIADGNYSPDGITSAINNAISLLGPGFSDVTFVINITNISDGPNGSGQMMVGLIAGSTVSNFSLNFQADKLGLDDRNTPLPLKLGWMLGFRNGIYVDNVNYVSEGVINVSGPRYLFLVVDDHNNSVNNGFYSAFNSSMLNNNILARISLGNTNSYSVLSQNNLNIVTSPRDYFGPVNIQNFVIQLLDEYGRVVDLNNMDFSFCVSLITVYDI
jgi:hypothetical protein